MLKLTPMKEREKSFWIDWKTWRKIAPRLPQSGEVLVVAGRPVFLVQVQRYRAKSASLSLAAPALPFTLRRVLRVVDSTLTNKGARA